MVKKVFCGIVSVLLFMTTLAVTYHPSIAGSTRSYEGHDANAMWVDPLVTLFDASDPNNRVGYRFNVTIHLNMTSGVYLYEVGLLYDRTLLRATQAGFTHDSVSEFMSGHTTAPITILIDTFLGNGSVVGGESLIGNDVIVPPHYGSLFWIEFEVVTLPRSRVNLTSLFDITTRTDATYVLNPDLQEIPVVTYDGTYQFLPDTTPPAIKVLSPCNLTYTTGDIPLMFTTNESTSWIGYSIDCQENITTNSNTSLSGVGNGQRSLIVYATDEFDNVGFSDFVFFSADFRIDLSIASPDITFSDDNPSPSKSITITATVHNDGGQYAENITVDFYDGNISIGERLLSSIPYFSSVNTSIEWMAHDEGFHLMRVAVDSYNVISETNEDNNIATRSLLVGAIPQYGEIALTASVNPNGAFYAGRIVSYEDMSYMTSKGSGTFEAELYVTYTGRKIGVYGNTTYRTTYGSGEPAAGASVTIMIRGWSEEFTHTIADGTYDKEILAPYSPGNYTISVTVTDHTFSTSNEIPLTVLQEGGIDLTLSSTDISFAPTNPVDHETVNLKATVHNVGTLNASNIQVAFCVDNNLFGTGMIAQIPAGGNTETQTSWNATPWGVHTVRVVVDPDNLIPELSKGNNEASKDIYVSPPLPDLTPTNVWFSDNTPVINQPIGIFASIANVGGTLATNVYVSFYDNGQSVGNVTISAVAGKGGSQTVTVIYAFSSAGYHQVCVVVDPENDILEADETNNRYCTALEVHIPLPDLTLTASDIVFSNSGPTIGDNVTIYATVYNVGETGANSVTVTFLDGNLKIAETAVISSIGSNSQASTSVFWNASSEGWHQMKVIVDENNTVAESNENNNLGSRYIYVSPRVASDPCVYENDIVFSNTCPEDGKSVTIYATIHNIGESEAQNVLVRFYVDGVQTGSPATVLSIPVNGQDMVSTRWIASQVGSHVVKVNADTAVESNKNNNNATRAIVVGFHDLTLNEITKMKTVVCQGFSVPINVTVENPGYYFETFNVTLYANSTVIKTESSTVEGNKSIIMTFNWNTSSFVKGNWTINAYTWPVADETDTHNNMLTKGWVVVSMIGDVSGRTLGIPDGKVDMRDIGAVARLFGVNYPSPLYAPNYDIDGDGKIDMRDIGTVARHFGEVDQ